MGSTVSSPTIMRTGNELKTSLSTRTLPSLCKMQRTTSNSSASSSRARNTQTAALTSSPTRPSLSRSTGKTYSLSHTKSGAAGLPTHPPANMHTTMAANTRHSPLVEIARQASRRSLSASVWSASTLWYALDTDLGLLSGWLRDRDGVAPHRLQAHTPACVLAPKKPVPLLSLLSLLPPFSSPSLLVLHRFILQGDELEEPTETERNTLA